MKNLKTIIALVLLCFTFSNCDTQSHFNDLDIKSIYNSRTSSNLRGDIGILVEFSSQTDQTFISEMRNSFINHDGIDFSTWETCSDKNIEREMWSIGQISIFEFIVIANELGYPDVVDINTTLSSTNDDDDEPVGENPYVIYYDANCSTFTN